MALGYPCCGSLITGQHKTGCLEKREIESKIGDLVDLLAVYVDVDIDLKVWKQLLIYVPKDLGTK